MPKYTHTALCPNYSGGPVPEEKFTHSHPSCSPDILYQLPPATTIHSILFVQFTCLTVLFHNLCPGPLWSSSWSGTLCLMAKYMCVEWKVGNSEFVCLLCRTAEPERVQRVHAVPAAHLSGVRIIPVSVL